MTAMPVLVTTLVGGLVAVAAYAGPGQLAIAVAVLAAVLAYGLLRAGDLPERVLGGSLIILTAAGAALSVLASDVEPGAETSFAPVLRAVGPAVVAVLLVALARPKARDRAVEWLAVTASGVLLAALGAALLALGRLDDLGPELIVIMVVAAVVGSATAVPPARRLLGWLWSVGWLAVGTAAAFLVPIGLVDHTDRLVLGGAVAVAAALAAAAVAGVPSVAHWTVRAALVTGGALAVAAPVAATAARVLLA